MKRILFLLVGLLAVTACKQKVTPAELGKLNGYWEIEKVVLPDGTEKEYTVNPTIDFFEVNGSKGTRKKVMPQFDGTYVVNDASEDVTLATDANGNVLMNYTTDYAKWTEELLVLEDDKLVVKNQHGIKYYYKKPQPFTVSDGEKI